MAGKRKKRRRGQRIEDRASSALESLLVGLGELLAKLVRGFGRVVRTVLSYIGGASRGSKFFAAAIAALLVAGYYNYRMPVQDDAVWVDSEVEALARVIRSEVGHSPTNHRVHVAWATRNLAAERKQTIAEMACNPCGRQQRGRPVSSRMRARDRDRRLAKHILNQPVGFDPTGGTTHFINPVVQDKLAKSGRVPGYRGRTYKSVRRRWIQKYNWEPYYRLGPDLEMWGNKRKR